MYDKFIDLYDNYPKSQINVISNGMTVWLCKTALCTWSLIAFKMTAQQGLE